MSEIRPLRPEDTPAVAQLFQRTFRDAARPAPASLADYLRALYLEGPDHDPEISAKVHVREDGVVTGFIGAYALPMTFEGRAVRAAVCGSLMVDGHADDPLAGARLLRAFLAGPQELSLSETANTTSTAMWRRLKGAVLPTYSLDWLYPLRPAAFCLDLGASAIGAARLALPAAAAVDGLLDLAGVLARQRPERGATRVEALDEDALVALIPRFLERFELRPDWSPAGLRDLLRHAERKAQDGPGVRCAVFARGEAPVGAFLYHGRRGRIGKVLQVLAAPGREGLVLDALLSHAAEAGLAGLRGRLQPPFFDHMNGRPFLQKYAGSTVAHARDPALIAAFTEGRAFFNGLAGEGWTRLAGDAFD